jgi:hypothetical protein
VIAADRFVIVSAGDFDPTPALTTRAVAADDGLSVAELVWGLATWLALPWLETGRIQLTARGFWLTDLAVAEIFDRARDHGLPGVMHRLGVRLRAAWQTDARAPAAPLVRLWNEVAIGPDGAIRAAASPVGREQAIGELYGYCLVQDCVLFDLVAGPLATGLWGTLVEPALATGEGWSPSDARTVHAWVRAAGEAAARGGWLANADAPTVERPFYLPAHEAATPGAFPRDARALVPSFALPLGLHGFHSGWMDDREVDPRSALGFASRRVVRLRAVESVPIWRATTWRDGDLPLLIKHVDGAFVGVTSGAGGALVPFGDRVLKLKRCGYKYLGVQAGGTHDRQVGFRDGVLIERTYDGAMGLGEVDDLLTEHAAFEILAELGVPAASRPSLLVGLPADQLVLSPPAGCLVTEVTTDVRADEVFVLALTHGDPDHDEPRAVVHDLGRAVGGLYRRLHDARVVRGNGNSWYGNDALCADGAIALCDLEGILPEVDVAPALHRLFRELDLHMFKAGVMVSCGTIRGGDAERTFAFADRLLRAFEAGYASRAEPRAPIAAAFVAKQLAAPAQNA